MFLPHKQGTFCNQLYLLPIISDYQSLFPIIILVFCPNSS